MEANLNESELRILSLIGEGRTNNQIAQALHTSVRTIENRRKRILLKTQTTNTATMIKYAVKQGLIS